MNMTIAYIIKFVHFVVALLNTVAIGFLFYFAPWYISIPLVTTLMTRILNRDYTCILTDLENLFRIKAGKEPLGYFLEDISDFIKRI